MIGGSLFYYFVTALTYSTGILAQGTGKFFTPPQSGDNRDYSNDRIYRIGEVETIKFTTVYSNYSIKLWQQDIGGGGSTDGLTIFQTPVGDVTEFDWLVQVFSFDLRDSPVFFLQLTPPDNSNGGAFTSHYFNVTAGAVSSSSSITTALPTTSSTATPSTTTTASSSGGSPTLSPSPTENAGSLSTGAQAGIGAGVGLAGLVAIAGAAFFIWRRRKNSDKLCESAVDQNFNYQPYMAMGTSNDGQPKLQSPYPVELNAIRAIAELK